MLNRKVFCILIFIISLCYFSSVIYASNQETVYLVSSEKEVNQGEEIEITVNIENSKVAACNFSIYFEEEKFEFASDLIQEENIENLKVARDKINFVWFDKLGGKEAKEGKIASFKFRAKENGKTTFTINGEFYNTNGQLINTNFKEEQVKIGKEDNLQKQLKEEQGTNLDNNNCNLQSLRTNIQGLVPNFEKEVKEYYLTVPNDVQDLEILAVSENPNAIVEIKGNNKLKEEINDIEIKVTSADKTQSKVYIIHVSKTSNLELANTNLETLAIENALLNPPFDNLQTNYEVEVPNVTENLNILAVPENEQATIEIIGKENLKDGVNLVTVLVKAADGFTKKSYIIKVNRRNLNEEKKYQEEQEKQIEALENAYKIEKTSADITNYKLDNINKQSNKYQAIRNWIIIIFVIIVIVSLTWKIRKK